MDNIIDNTGANLARCLRHERQARHWSMADLADRSGVSKASISKIEREEFSPTAAILVRLAGAFDMTLAGLLLKAEGGGERLSRAANQPIWRDPDTHYRRKQVFCRPDHPVELVEVELPAGQTVTLPASSYSRIRQLVWVQKGGVIIDEGGERHELTTGDCLGFGPPSEVTFVNDGALPCTYIVALSRS